MHCNTTTRMGSLPMIMARWSAHGSSSRLTVRHQCHPAPRHAASLRASTLLAQPTTAVGKHHRQPKHICTPLCMPGSSWPTQVSGAENTYGTTMVGTLWDGQGGASKACCQNHIKNEVKAEQDSLLLQDACGNWRSSGNRRSTPSFGGAKAFALTGLFA